MMTSSHRHATAEASVAAFLVNLAVPCAKQRPSMDLTDGAATSGGAVVACPSAH